MTDGVGAVVGGLGRTVVVVGVCAAAISTAFADSGLGLPGPDAALGLPSLWRVLGAFGIVALLAVGAALLTRRLRAGSAGEPAGNAGVRLVSSKALSAAARVHLIECDDQRYLIVETRSGVAIATAERLRTPDSSPMADR